MMHPYSVSIESNERARVPIIVAAVSVAIATILNYASVWPSRDLAIWLSAPSVFGVYGVLWIYLDRVAWRLRPVRLLLGISTPIINGVWDGELRSSLESYSKPFRARLTLHQRWTTLSVFLEGQDVYSHSLIGALRELDPTHIEFSYVYVSERKPRNAIFSEFRHYGTCRLMLKIPATGRVEEMDGSYYTDLERHTYGTAKFSRPV